MSLSRRDFVERTALAAAAGFVPRTAFPEPVRPIRGGPPHPVIVSSANGLRGVAKAWEMVAAGADPLDAIIAGVNIQELDPADQSVGLGGLPNEDGVVQLDASCMHGPTNRAGAVGCLEDIATPSLVAKAVMDYTDHILLVGADARRFALAMGFQPQNLLTEKSRQDWLRWKAQRSGSDAWLDHVGDVRINWTHGTINMNAVTPGGDLASVTTTSGRAYKIAGRVGDSAVVGAGQYCDNRVGAAGSTGWGEANIRACGGFLAVQMMREGKAPVDAGLEALRRVAEMTEPRHLGANGRPDYDIQFYLVAKDGRYAGVSLYSGDEFAVCDARGARLEPCVPLFPRAEKPAPRPMRTGAR